MGSAGGCEGRCDELRRGDKGPPRLTEWSTRNHECLVSEGVEQDGAFGLGRVILPGRRVAQVSVMFGSRAITFSTSGHRAHASSVVLGAQRPTAA